MTCASGHLPVPRDISCAPDAGHPSPPTQLAQPSSQRPRVGQLVARGREFFVAAIQQPEELLPAEFLDALEGVGMEIMYEAEKQYLARTGQEFVAACEGPYFDLDDTAYGPLIDDALRS